MNARPRMVRRKWRVLESSSSLSQLASVVFSVPLLQSKLRRRPRRKLTMGSRSEFAVLVLG